MSIPMDGNAARGALSAGVDALGGGGTSYSQRQLRLNKLYAFFRCEHYNERTVDWDGSPSSPDELGSQISIQGFTPPGFENVSEQTLPIRYRKPTAPYHLGRVIVERFTGLLFSQRRHPKIDVPGDQDTEDFLEAVVEVGSLWARLVQGRNYGGSMGSVGLGFKLMKGLPQFEVFDPRWSTPEFNDPIEQEPIRFVYEFPFTDWIRDAKGNLQPMQFVYRRVIDTTKDCIWRKLRIDVDPEMVEPDVCVEHNLGFCPAVWIQNQEVQGEIDGDCDLHGCHPMIMAMDALIAQANRGILANCDPSLLITSDEDLDSVQKGSGIAIKLEKGGSAQYLEINGMGPKAALEMADRFEQLICRTARMVLDQSSAVMKTATEVDRDYSSMLEKADVLREQYGERGVKALLRIVLKVCRSALQPKLMPDGRMSAPELKLPPKVSTDPKTGEVTFLPRKLGMSEVINLQWGPYFQPTLDDANKAVQAASMAKEKGLVDPESAVKFIAAYFGIQDVPATLHKIATAQEEELQKLQDMANQQMEKDAEKEEPTEEEEPEDEDADSAEMDELGNDLAEGEEPVEGEEPAEGEEEPAPEEPAA